MIRLLPDTFETIGSFTYRNLVRRERKLPAVVHHIAPIVRVRAEGLPPMVAGVVATSDLQGAGGSVSAPRLPTHDALDALDALAASGDVPALADMIMCLGGDHFARLGLDKRGGAGDVTEVWRDAASRTRAVVGVIGNHDRFAHPGLVPPLLSPLEIQANVATNAHYVDGYVAEVGGLRVGGVSGVIGDIARPHRRTEEGFLEMLEIALCDDPDLLLLHQGPAPEHEFRLVSPRLRALCAAWPGLTIYGHDRVPQRFEELPSGAQFLSVLERVVVIVP